MRWQSVRRWRISGGEALKKIDLGRALGILANVGVLIGILLLVYELGQNRQMMQAQTRNAIAGTLINLRFNEANSDELSQIGLKMAQGEKLTPVEEQRFQALWDSYFRYWENVHYQYRSGLYDDSEYSAQREAWRNILLSFEAVREYLCSRRRVQSADFFAEMDELMGNERCE